MATIGFDIVVGAPRYDFGAIHLLGGIPFIPLVIEMVEMRDKPPEFDPEKLTLKDSLLTEDAVKRILPPGLRSSLLGTGRVEGVAATEAGNNSAAAGVFAPLLSLGTPGSGAGAVLLGGLLMYGLDPRPFLFLNRPEFTWGLIASLYAANAITLLVAPMIVPWLKKVPKAPATMMIPVITTTCIT